MHRKGTRAATLAAACVFLGCPMGPLSGGHLRGAVHEADVDDWSFVGDVTTCQLETNPSEPHSVNTWCLGWGRYLYIPTSMILGPEDPGVREWVQNVLAESEVRVRIEGTVYELDAEQVLDDVEYASVLEALEAKYELDPAERDPDREIWLFRMQPR
jgi:hypothetical protein